ncbi:MAG TPA: HIT family protein [Acidimicrobiales bacterium]|nr:HIT family protein [Acidimicrobiales bacterium]
MADCRFCEILAGEVAAHLVLDEERVAAFLDVRPVFPGHVLVVPREHHENLLTLPADLVPVVFGATRRVARAVQGGLDVPGTFVGINNTVSQSVAHLHVHVIPRRFKDGLRGFFWPRQRYADDAEMADWAARIRPGVTAAGGAGAPPGGGAGG